MRPSRAAFSLIELLVVIAILALLATILSPALQGVAAMARASQCASNLHNIGVASASVGGPAGPISSFGWREAFLPHLGDETEALICPEGMYKGDTVEGGGYYVEVTSGGRFLYNMALEEETFTLREDISDTAYLLKFEDIRPGGGDMDFNDLILKVERSGETTMRITYLSINAGYHFNLRGADGSILMADLGRVTPSGTFHEVSGGDASYGMTSLAGRITAGSHVTYVLDYQRAVANVAGNDATDNWQKWAGENGEPMFARHNGKCNVLFTDASVNAVHHLDLDPDVPGALQMYWVP